MVGAEVGGDEEGRGLEGRDEKRSWGGDRQNNTLSFQYRI